jgi:hypothetical protein
MRQTEALRRKRAELAMSPMVVVGVLLHIWGMLDRHRFVRAVDMPLWSRALFRLCWIVLAILMTWMGLGALKG